MFFEGIFLLNSPPLCIFFLFFYQLPLIKILPLFLTSWELGHLFIFKIFYLSSNLFDYFINISLVGYGN
ncbi:hypothetical protein Mgra_00007495 [Meloidogyne graminicola]|uniref:Uncharacterized protein n=1 Tax=Meloidogyne graminicola TaxID=189291 RepID=A0A8S9ZIC2_9BILA|nr:hypothetical protein Mgra_00007495 [Meloidogyne graminicola]